MSLIERAKKPRGDTDIEPIYEDFSTNVSLEDNKYIEIPCVKPISQRLCRQLYACQFIPFAE